MKAKKGGDLDEAENICRRAQVSFPRDPNILCLLGEVLLKQGRTQEALSWFTRTLVNFPGYPRALEGSGRSLLAEKRAAKAVKFLKRAAKRLPDRSSTHLALSRALLLAGKGHEAESALQRALQLDPGRAAVARAADLLSDERPREAEDILRKHLAASPDDPRAMRLLAQIALDANHRRAALKLLERTVEVAPDFVLAWNNLADLYMKEERFDLALETAEKAIELDPELPHSYVVKGNLLSKAQRHDEALAAYDRALAISPGHSGALSSKGHALKTIGRTDEAIASFRQCIRLHPGFGEPYWSLANLKTFSFDEEEVAVVRQMLEREDLPDENKVNMYYALGKHFENQEDFETAFSHYSKGAGLRRPHETYDPVQNQVVHERIIEVFNEDLFNERSGWGDQSEDPILIVGLPRSGSTLIEQILASHSQVEGTLELPDLPRCIREVSRSAPGREEYPEAVRDLSEKQVRALGQRYMRTTERYRTGKPFFIDKMPNNFSHVGFLHLILPNAKVINARRHPLDACLGCFKQLFYKGQSFTYDFFELGQYYLQYQRVMDHWQAVLPGKVLDVQYEDMVADQEGQTRRILEHLGLP
ncbi:MAG: sulfotransferase, partial [Xanthomonadales bacterium]|nr:sulfotransferase [Xanthomonadales bacterium]